MYRSDNAFHCANKTKIMTFQIESTTYCPSGSAPRWTWWIRGIAGTARYGVVGTDEQGCGLYLYEAHGDHTPDRVLLLDASNFNLLEEISKAEATGRLTAALSQLGWGPVESVVSTRTRPVHLMPVAITSANQPG